jgi:hypothetical protein
MDEAGQASTDYTVLPPSDALKETFMNKLNFVVYPAVAILSLAAAISAHAQSRFDPIDQAAYGATPAAAAQSPVTRAQVKAELVQARADGLVSVSIEGYEPTVRVATQRSRAEVRAEAISARAAGYDEQYREGGPGVVTQARVVDTTRVLAGSIDKNVK